MTGRLARAARWLERRAENVAAMMLAVLFGAFILQVLFRYVLNLPVGWTSELSTIMWIWLVLWGAAFVVREREEIRFDIVYGSVGPAGRRVLCVLTAIGLVVLYAMSLPAVFDYVTFMKVQKTAYLALRFDYVYAIYVLFVVAVIVRYCWLGWRAIAGPGAESASDEPGSGA